MLILIILLMERFEVTRLNYVATDLAANYMRDTVDAMDDRTFEFQIMGS